MSELNFNSAAALDDDALDSVSGGTTYDLEAYFPGATAKLDIAEGKPCPRCGSSPVYKCRWTHTDGWLSTLYCKSCKNAWKYGGVTWNIPNESDDQEWEDNQGLHQPKYGGGPQGGGPHW